MALLLLNFLNAIIFQVMIVKDRMEKQWEETYYL